MNNTGCPYAGELVLSKVDSAPLSIHFILSLLIFLQHSLSCLINYDVIINQTKITIRITFKYMRSVIFIFEASVKANNKGPYMGSIKQCYLFLKLNTIQLFNILSVIR